MRATEASFGSLMGAAAVASKIRVTRDLDGAWIDADVPAASTASIGKEHIGIAGPIGHVLRLTRQPALRGLVARLFQSRYRVTACARREADTHAAALSQTNRGRR